MLNLPPGMMPNVPLGVPPPNLQGQLMSNPLLGIGSPFQGAGLMAPPPMTLQNDNGQGAVENMKNLTESLMGLGQFNMMAQLQHQGGMMQEDNMDVEMEDAVRSNQDTHVMHSDSRASVDKDRNRDDRGDRRDRDRERDRNDRNRDRRRSRSRDRERERERERDRDRDRNRWVLSILLFIYTG